MRPSMPVQAPLVRLLLGGLFCTHAHFTLSKSDPISQQIRHGGCGAMGMQCAHEAGGISICARVRGGDCSGTTSPGVRVALRCGAARMPCWSVLPRQPVPSHLRPSQGRHLPFRKALRPSGRSGRVAVQVALTRRRSASRRRTARSAEAPRLPAASSRTEEHRPRCPAGSTRGTACPGVYGPRCTART